MMSSLLPVRFGEIYIRTRPPEEPGQPTTIKGIGINLKPDSAKEQYLYLEKEGQKEPILLASAVGKRIRNLVHKRQTFWNRLFPRRTNADLLKCLGNLFDVNEPLQATITRETDRTFNQRLMMLTHINPKHNRPAYASLVRKDGFLEIEARSNFPKLIQTMPVKEVKEAEAPVHA